MANIEVNRTTEVLSEILNERLNQDAEWGQQNHSPDHWLSILMEEVGEMAKENLERNGDKYREELVQVAAVAVAMIESYDRGNF